MWNSLHTGSSGSDGPTGGLHYEEDFYTTLGLGFGGGISLGTTYHRLHESERMFTTVKELSFKVSKAHMLAPYGVLAFEMGGDESGQADGGTRSAARRAPISNLASVRAGPSATAWRHWRCQ